MTTRSFGVAALLLVTVAALGRPSLREEPSAAGASPRLCEPPPGPAPRDAVEHPTTAPAAELPPITDGLGPARRIEQDAEETFWAKVREHLAGDRGESLLDATAAYLGWDEPRKAAAWSCVRTIDDAWRIRDVELLSGGPAADERYGELKRTAIAGLGALLDGSRERHRRFETRLEEWIDAVR